MQNNDSFSRIKNFPITAFAIIMGLCGFTIALWKFNHLGWFPVTPYFAMLTITTFLFMIILTMYSLKFINYPDEVKKDFKHKVRINFFPTISISILLLSIAFLGVFPLVSVSLWLLGTTFHTILMLMILSSWIRKEYKVEHFNPAWFIPVVGNILIPVAGVAFFSEKINAFYLILGLFFWIILSAIVFNRLIFHSPLPEKLLPTFFIIIAPPAVGFISYMRTTKSFDFISQGLLFLTYFSFIFILFLGKSFKNIKFYLSWWAFTFPIAAMTIASTVAFQITKLYNYAYISWLSMGLLTIIISLVSFVTIIKIKNKQICVEED